MFGDVVGALAKWLQVHLGLMSQNAWESQITNALSVTALIVFCSGCWGIYRRWSGPMRAPRPDKRRLNILIADLNGDPGQRRSRELCKALDEWGSRTGIPITVHALHRHLEYQEFLSDEGRLKVARAALHWLAITGYDVLIWGNWSEAAGAPPTYALRFATWNPAWHTHGFDKLRPFGHYVLKHMAIVAELPEQLATDVGRIAVEAARRYLEGFEHGPDDSRHELLDDALTKIHALMTAKLSVIDDEARNALAELFLDTVQRMGATLPSHRHRQAAHAWIEARILQAPTPSERTKWEAREFDDALNDARRDPEPTALQRLVEQLKKRSAEIDRKSFPLEWAAAQIKLARALHPLGNRQNKLVLAEEALAACRAALEELTRERVPLEWAMAQHCLGNALSLLAKREIGTTRLEEAAAAYREALQERSRQRVPLEWARTQRNLASNLQNIAMKDRGTARLEEAVANYRVVLQECTRDRFPMEWAETQTHLARAVDARRARGWCGSLGRGCGRVSAGVRRANPQTRSARMGGNKHRPSWCVASPRNPAA